MKIVNIYGQESYHMPARIVGNREGLLELLKTISCALNNPGVSVTEDPLYASDGEGYEIQVEMKNDEWGCDAPADSYWNKPESDPQYTGENE